MLNRLLADQEAQGIDEGMVEGAELLGVGTAVALDGGGESGAVGAEEGTAEGLPFLAVAAGTVDDAELPEAVDEVVEHVGRAEPEDPRRVGGAFLLVEGEAQTAAEGRLLLAVGGDEARLGELLDASPQGVDTDGIAVAKPYKMTLGGGGDRPFGSRKDRRGIVAAGKKAPLLGQEALDFFGTFDADTRPCGVGPLAVETAPERQLLLESDVMAGHHTLQ